MEFSSPRAPKKVNQVHKFLYGRKVTARAKYSIKHLIPGAPSCPSHAISTIEGDSQSPPNKTTPVDRLTDNHTVCVNVERVGRITITASERLDWVPINTVRPISTISVPRIACVIE